MGAVLDAIAIVLQLYWLVLIARLVFDLVQVFARSWEPRGFLLLLAEGIYTITDPPIKAVRRVVPPLRLGSVQFDLAFLIVLIGLQILINVLVSLA